MFDKKEYFINENAFSVEEPYDRIELWLNKEFQDAKVLPSNKTKEFCEHLDSKGFKRIYHNPFSETKKEKIKTRKEKMLKSFYSGFVLGIQSVIYATIAILLITIFFIPLFLCERSWLFLLLYFVMIPAACGVYKAVETWIKDMKEERHRLIRQEWENINSFSF